MKNFFKLLIFLLYIYLLKYYVRYELFKKFRESNIKVCICTLAKDENKYILEFVEHYKKYGIDKIYLYDNNDIDGERFDDILRKYIEDEFVLIKDWRGIKGTSTYYGIMDSCYQTYHDQYDWLIFYEIDEFLYLKNYKNIKSYLISNRFKKCESIQLNWVHMSDNNKIYYENKSLAERFPEIGKNVNRYKFTDHCINEWYIKIPIFYSIKN